MNNNFLWESWIEITNDPILSYTLHVVGKLFWNERRIKPALCKCLKDLKEGILELEVRPGVFWREGEMQKITYSEELHSIKQYNSIQINLGTIEPIILNGIKVEPSRN